MKKQTDRPTAREVAKTMPDTPQSPVSGLAQALQRSRADIIRHEHRFMELFKMPIKAFYGDNALTMALGFDIVKFGNRISAKHFNNSDWYSVDDPRSLNEVIAEFYGADAAALVKGLL